MAPIVQPRFKMRALAGVIAVVCTGSIALADPYKPPPSNPALPVVTVSNMPVSKRIPGWWDSTPHTDALVATTVTGVLAAAIIGWWAYHDHYAFKAEDAPTIKGFNENEQKQHFWQYSEFGLGVATLTSAFISAALWARHYHPAHEVLVWPTQGGASVGMSKAF